MNIFVTDTDPTVAVRNLDSKRVVKMVLESAQMLSTAINEHGRGRVRGPYKTTHKNHPANVWVRQTKSNYLWLLEHFKSLCKEYTARYNKTHKCEHYLSVFIVSASIIPKGKLTPFANCAAHVGKNISYKHIKPTTLAYQMYLVERWNTDKRKPEWSRVNVAHRCATTVYPHWLRIIKDRFYHKKDPVLVTLYGENSNIGNPYEYKNKSSHLLDAARYAAYSTTCSWTGTRKK